MTTIIHLRNLYLYLKGPEYQTLMCPPLNNYQQNTKKRQQLLLEGLYYMEGFLNNFSPNNHKDIQYVIETQMYPTTVEMSQH